MEVHMPRFILNKNEQSNGDREVHEVGCSHAPDKANQIDLGVHATCKGALLAARKITKNADGCYYCCNDCHKS